MLQMSKRAFQSLLNGFEPEVLTSTRPEVTSDRCVFFQCRRDVLVLRKTMYIIIK